MDKVDPTPAKLQSSIQAMPWEQEAQKLLNKLISEQPVLTQISAAKKSAMKLSWKRANKILKK